MRRLGGLNGAPGLQPQQTGHQLTVLLRVLHRLPVLAAGLAEVQQKVHMLGGGKAAFLDEPFLFHDVLHQEMVGFLVLAVRENSAAPL